MTDGRAAPNAGADAAPEAQQEQGPASDPMQAADPWNGGQPSPDAASRIHAWLLDKTNSPTQHHLDRQLLALTHLGNKLELAHHPHLPHDVSRWLWTFSFNAYVNR